MIAIMPVGAVMLGEESAGGKERKGSIQLQIEGL